MNNKRDKKALTNEIGEYTVDSCYTCDQGYETGIVKGYGNWVIVERYSTREEMEKGHEKWCEFCKQNPIECYSVQTGIIEQF
jgi:hypothetical protein